MKGVRAVKVAFVRVATADMVEVCDESDQGVRGDVFGRQSKLRREGRMSVSLSDETNVIEVNDGRSERILD